MKSVLKKITIGFIGLIIIFGIGIIGPVKANSADDEVDLRIRVEVSTDNGQTWQNTSGSDYSGGQTVNLCQGENFQIRTRIWNSGTRKAYQVTGLSSCINSANNANPGQLGVTANTNDEDSDGVTFLRMPFTNNGSIYVATVAPNGSYDNGYQGSILTIQPPNQCPTPGTEIYLTTNIQGYALNSGGGPGQLGPGPLIIVGLKSARAAGIGNRSSVKIVLCGCQSAETQETAVGSGSIEELPQTGAELN